MSNSANFAAIDLGAESGRVILGTVSDDKLELTDLHRFPNGPIRTLDELHWDVLRLFDEMKKGLAAAGRQAGGPLESIGVDTWGVDYGLLGPDGALLENPYHYRDARTNGKRHGSALAPPPPSGFQLPKLHASLRRSTLSRLASTRPGAGAKCLYAPSAGAYYTTSLAGSENTILTGRGRPMRRARSLAARSFRFLLLRCVEY